MVLNDSSPWSYLLICTRAGDQVGDQSTCLRDPLPVPTLCLEPADLRLELELG